MSLNSHWIQKYKPSKLSNRKKRPFFYFSTKTDVFFKFNQALSLYLDP